MRWRVLSLAAVVFTVSGAALASGFDSRVAASQTPAAAPALPPDFETQFADAWAKQPRIDLGIPADGAKVVIVKFNDWLCPACKQYHQLYQPILDKYQASHPGAVRVVVKDWPWNKECNLTSPSTFPGHESACTAAAAVRLAREKGKGDALVEWLFTNQTRLFEMGRGGQAAAASTEIKARLGTLVTGVDFEKAYAAKLTEIRRDVADGTALKVESTPTFFVNGVRTTTSRTATDQGGANLIPVVLDLAIRIELAKAAK